MLLWHLPTSTPILCDLRVQKISAPDMAPNEPLHVSLRRDTTAYLAFLLLVTTIGPLQFGYHMASPRLH